MHQIDAHTVNLDTSHSHLQILTEFGTDLLAHNTETINVKWKRWGIPK